MANSRVREIDSRQTAALLRNLELLRKKVQHRVDFLENYGDIYRIPARISKVKKQKRLITSICYVLENAPK